MTARDYSLNSLYRDLGQQLKRAGVDSPLFAAEWILRSVLGWDRSRFFMEMDSSVPESVRLQAEKWVHAHSRGIPIQYLTGEQEFFGRSFWVNPSVLIPRPETEELVETLFSAADSIWENRSLQVADLGSGSGAVAVTLAAERPHWQVYAVDVSPEAAAVTKRNAKRHGVRERMRFLQGDWLKPLVEKKWEVDILVSNPPYIPSEEIDGLETGVKDYEPRLALDGGADGLTPYRSIADDLGKVLRDPGLVAFEIGVGQGEDVVGILKQRWSSNADTRILLDLAGRERMVLASKGRLPDSL
ncbi:peptide chain release factor N(5)-glutamine methyltransferase [Desmospora profundinema]|uniref:Release factor glutamine methyltransferase n=1 Tax=Desmospora profundinema TaxID=1571184 RepID=A0ABU1IL39_9BACL|nr:peptide chain release factor N(5)-glutamine methyltransferase [Desmospora profundinema]MDR6225495.1 release factor glutamine methyltransferase [Desmospora profundinema]